jgi:outer membrane murein-binding lipoprotein Lpp
VTPLTLAVVMTALFGLLTAVIVDLASQLRGLSRRVDDLQREVDRARSRHNISRLRGQR